MRTLIFTPHQHRRGVSRAPLRELVMLILNSLTKKISMVQILRKSTVWHMSVNHVSPGNLSDSAQRVMIVLYNITSTLVQEFGGYQFPSSNAHTFIPPSGEYHVGANSTPFYLSRGEHRTPWMRIYMLRMGPYAPRMGAYVSRMGAYVLRMRVLWPFEGTPIA